MTIIFQRTMQDEILAEFDFLNTLFLTQFLEFESRVF